MGWSKQIYIQKRLLKPFRNASSTHSKACVLITNPAVESRLLPLLSTAVMENSTVLEPNSLPLPLSAVLTFPSTHTNLPLKSLNQ